MQRRYLVKCWVRPKSGFDLARKNRIMSLFRSFLKDAFNNEEDTDQAVEHFEKEHEGMVLEPLIIESDCDIFYPDKQLLPEIQKIYPGARILSCEEMEELSQIPRA